VSLEKAAENLVRECRRRGLTVALAESCTGGLVAAALSAIPGASECLWGGVVVYTAEAKSVLAGLDPSRVRDAGVVSAEVTEELARSILERSGCPLALAVTGWAGPDSGGPDPVGCVYLSVASSSGCRSLRVVLEGPRQEVRRGAAERLLTMGLETLPPTSERGA